MASVEKRLRDGKTTWLARWRDPAGSQRKRSFPRRVDAERFLTSVDHGMLTGAHDHDDQKALSPATVGVVHGLVAAVFKAAVRDRNLTGSPCEGTKLPKREPKKVVPLATEAVQAPVDAVPARYEALVVLAAGTGLRQGEAIGLTRDRIDFLRRTLTVDRRLMLLPGRPPFPCTAKDCSVLSDDPAPPGCRRGAVGASPEVSCRA